jgi:hypothetical protein
MDVTKEISKFAKAAATRATSRGLSGSSWIRHLTYKYAAAATSPAREVIAPAAAEPFKGEDCGPVV